ncbi:hydantoinase/oxoprolinase family protein [Neobacillus sp. 179-J 1A1 HS]|uniref:hydantoinase/oxoprolinase family protein n=1 Tax=Neobacillus driksii TaxID=3035913 RepID=UPI0035BBA0A4
MSKIKIGVDVGGTFTDVVAVNDEGKFFFAKTSSTPEDQSIGVVNGITRILQDLNLSPKDVRGVAHGTTVATNTLLERTGAKTALITTEGFRDVLEIGRQNRPNLYDLHARRLEPLVNRNWRREVPERTLHTGEIIKELDESELQRCVRELISEGVESISICFLHSYANPANEQRALEMVKSIAPNLPISVSSNILPEFREFERMNTTVLNAYVQPGMERYISRLSDRIGSIGVKGRLTIMQSSGGMMTDNVAASRSVHTLLSGPAGGVLAAQFLAGLTGEQNLITVDLGGTSFDVSVIKDGEVSIRTQGEIEGYPVKFPHIDIHTIGSGGGSIARIDSGGALRVGPQSAGAQPGPACYGRGGTKPTVTDAHAVLGRVGSTLLGGELALDLVAARNAIDTHIASPLGIAIEDAAEGILRVVNSSMVRAIRVMTVERGIDPRKFTILPFGGAGALHSVDLARSLGMSKVMVPNAPGNFSAFGLLASPIRYDEVRTHRVHQNKVNLQVISELLVELETSARERLKNDEVEINDVLVERRADLRYFGQAYELSVPFPEGDMNDEKWRTLIEAFHKTHEQNYGFRKSEDPVEVVNLRVSVLSKNESTILSTEGTRRTSDLKPIEIRKAYFSGEWLDTSIYERSTLTTGDSFTGPAILKEAGSTTVIGPGDVATVDKWLNIMIEIATVGNADTNVAEYEKSGWK